MKKMNKKIEENKLSTLTNKQEIANRQEIISFLQLKKKNAESKI